MSVKTSVGGGEQRQDRPAGSIDIDAALAAINRFRWFLGPFWDVFLEWYDEPLDRHGFGRAIMEKYHKAAGTDPFSCEEPPGAPDELREEYHEVLRVRRVLEELRAELRREGIVILCVARHFGIDVESLQRFLTHWQGHELYPMEGVVTVPDMLEQLVRRLYLAKGHEICGVPSPSEQQSPDWLSEIEVELGPIGPPAGARHLNDGGPDKAGDTVTAEPPAGFVRSVLEQLGLDDDSYKPPSFFFPYGVLSSHLRSRKAMRGRSTLRTTVEKKGRLNHWNVADVISAWPDNFKKFSEPSRAEK